LKEGKDDAHGQTEKNGPDHTTGPSARRSNVSLLGDCELGGRHAAAEARRRTGAAVIAAGAVHETVDILTDHVESSGLHSLQGENSIHDFLLQASKSMPSMRIGFSGMHVVCLKIAGHIYACRLHALIPDVRRRRKR
jgi:hypothetical protein